eukprot:2204210-Rhodomonas_salina.1
MRGTRSFGLPGTCCYLPMRVLCSARYWPSVRCYEPVRVLCSARRKALQSLDLDSVLYATHVRRATFGVDEEARCATLGDDEGARRVTLGDAEAPGERERERKGERRDSEDSL